MSGLWEEIDGEIWLDNPSLIIANPRKRKRRIKAMAAKRRRRGRKAAPRRRRRARRNYAASGVIQNPRRRRRAYVGVRRRRPRSFGLIGRPRRRRLKANPRRRHYRRNPGVSSVLGFSIPPVSDILFAGAGLVVPPIMAGYITSMLPDSMKGSKFTYYGVKIASVVVPSMLVRRFVSRRAGNIMLLAGAASMAVDLVREFMPTLLPAGAMSGQPFLGFYERMPGRQLNGMGRYASIPVRSQSVQRTPMMIGTPDRLLPEKRF